MPSRFGDFLESLFVALKIDTANVPDSGTSYQWRGGRGADVGAVQRLTGDGWLE